VHRLWAHYGWTFVNNALMAFWGAFEVIVGGLTHTGWWFVGTGVFLLVSGTIRLRLQYRNLPQAPDAG
jgi:hypothetical protein